jgi:hypothetical protein
MRIHDVNSRSQRRHLNHLVPTARHDDGVQDVGAKPHARYPVNRVRTMRRGISAITYHSVWPSSLISYLHSPRVFQSLMVLSRDPETICLLSALKLTERTSELWPTNRRVVCPVLRSQRRRVWSQEAERANWPSEEITISETKWLCPCKIRFGYPYVSSSRVNCQTMIVLSVCDIYYQNGAGCEDKYHGRQSGSCLGSLRRLQWR